MKNNWIEIGGLLKCLLGVITKRYERSHCVARPH